MDNCL